MYFTLYISAIIWLIPPVRNNKTTLFYYFLLLAIHDPIKLIFKEIIEYDLPFEFSLLVAYLCFISLIKVENIKKTWLFVLTGMLLLIGATLYFQEYFVNIISLLICDLLIFIVLLKKFAEINVEFRSYSMFYVTLIFYQLTTLIKYSSFIIDTEFANEYFIVTSIFQILFGLFFSIFRENDSRLMVKLE